MKKITAALFLLLCSAAGLAQNVGIGTDQPHSSALLDVNSTTQGLLAPRMTEAQRLAINSPAKGLLVYQTDNTEGFYVYNGAAWAQLAGGGGLAGSGSAGQVAFFNGSNSLAGNSNLFWNNAAQRLGIGNNNPGRPLDISAAGGIRINRTENQNSDNELFFQNNGQIRAGDNNHRIIFDNEANTLELREFGQIVLSSGAINGNRTGRAVLSADGNFTVFNPEATSNTEVKLGAAWNRPGVYSSQSLQLFNNNNQPIVFGHNNTEYARFQSNGALGLGTATPHGSALLDLSSSNRGFLMPRMSTAAISNIPGPASGLMVYDETEKNIKVFGGSSYFSFFKAPVPFTVEFNYTGNEQSFTVPAGVSKIRVEVTGGRGGRCASISGGLQTFYLSGYGARVTTTLDVTPGETLGIFVGEEGGLVNGGYNGGGNGLSYLVTAANTTLFTGGGGGASDIRRGGNSLANRIAVAGGGGGAGWSVDSFKNGGNAGLEGQNGQGALPGGGGTQTAGGAAGGAAFSGALGFGGSAIISSASPTGVGGGGGAGYYGGGGSQAGGGGGGSSFVTPAGSVNTSITSAVITTPAEGAGHGKIVITYIFDADIPAPYLNGSNITGLPAATITGTLPAASLPPGTTTLGNTVNAAGGLVQLDAAGQLPPLNGSQLTGLSLNNAGGVLRVSRGGTGVSSFATGQLLYGNDTSAIAASSNLFWNAGAMRLGIGTAAPAKALDVAAAGGIRIGRTEAASSNNEIYFADNGQIRSNDDNHRIIFDRAANIIELREYGDLHFSSGALTGNRTSKAVLLGNGNFGIGTAAPAAKLDVDGSVRFRIGTPAAGSVLVSADAAGNAVWKSSLQLNDSLVLNGTFLFATGAAANRVLVSSGSTGAAAWSDHLNLPGNASVAGTAVFNGQTTIGAPLVANNTITANGSIFANTSLTVNNHITVTDGIIQKLGTAAPVSGTTDLGLYSRIQGGWLRFVTQAGDVVFYRSDNIDGSGTTETMRISGENGKISVNGANFAEQLTVGGNIFASGRVRQKVYKFNADVPPMFGIIPGEQTITFTHNLGYEPAIMMSLENNSTAFSNTLNRVTVIYKHVNNNTIEFKLTNTGALDNALGSLNVIIVE